jgi:hypothetical protein
MKREFGIEFRAALAPPRSIIRRNSMSDVWEHANRRPVPSAVAIQCMLDMCVGVCGSARDGWFFVGGFVVGRSEDAIVGACVGSRLGPVGS